MSTLQTLNPAAGGGLASASDRRKLQTFIANGAIVAGDVVMFDVSKASVDSVLYVKQASLLALGQPLACGVALEAAVDGGHVQVVISGWAVANCTANTGTIIAGSPLVACVVTAGEVEVRVAADTAPAFGVALEAADTTTTNFVNISIYPQF